MTPDPLQQTMFDVQIIKLPTPRHDPSITITPIHNYSFSSNIAEMNSEEETVEEAIERVYDAAAEEWKAKATEIIHQLCQNQSEFDLDTVAEKLKPIDYIKHKPRAVGGLMRHAKSKGWCKQVGVTTSKRLSRHHGYIAQYESLI